MPQIVVHEPRCKSFKYGGQRFTHLALLLTSRVIVPTLERVAVPYSVPAVVTMRSSLRLVFELKTFERGK